MSEQNQCCPIEKTLKVIGGKWTILILRDLFDGTKRFGELRKSLDGISPKTLSERLKQLEGEGIVSRIVHPEIPPRVEYSLTERGQTLRPIFEEMRVWSSR